MKKKQKVDLIISILLIMIGIVLTLLPNFKMINMNVILFSVMMIYATLNMIQYVLTKISNDYEGLFTALVSYMVGFTGIIFKLFDKQINLVVILLAWITLMSLIKFKKCDYYNDRNNKMWIIRIITLILFIVTGLLTCINLYYSKNVNILILGFFFYIHGILEMIDPLTNYYMESK